MSSLARYPSLAGRSVLVTGGASGIGATLVERFVEQGAKVGFVDVDGDSGDTLAARLGANAFFVRADVTEIPELQAAIEQIAARHGAPTVLMNNAANDRRHTVESVTSAFWDAAVAVNLKHQFFAAQAVMAGMRDAGGGAIVNFGSVSWLHKQGGMPVYLTCKAAIHGLTRALATDFGPHGIRVNTLLPGWVLTDKQLKLWVTPETLAEVAKYSALAGPLLPDHIASMALFLAADDSAQISAQEFIVDGGWT
jgi:D-xylose 1-dehydrogenase